MEIKSQQENCLLWYNHSVFLLCRMSPMHFLKNYRTAHSKAAIPVIKVYVDSV